MDTNEMRSQVEIKSNEVKVGTILYYTDAANYCKWEVLGIFEGGFVARNEYEVKDFWFDELQIGWTF